MGQAQGTPAYWVPDAAANECAVCSRSFSVVVRRHHCRRCGQLCCRRCSAEKSSVPERGFGKPSRVCDLCLIVLRAKSREVSPAIDRIDFPITPRYADDDGTSSHHSRTLPTARSESLTPSRHVPRRAPSNVSPRRGGEGSEAATTAPYTRSRTRSSVQMISSSPTSTVTPLAVPASERYGLACFLVRAVKRGMPSSSRECVSRLVEAYLASPFAWAATRGDGPLEVHSVRLSVRVRAQECGRTGFAVAYPKLPTQGFVVCRFRLSAGSPPTEICCAHESVIKNVTACQRGSVAEIKGRTAPIGLTSDLRPVGLNSGQLTHASPPPQSETLMIQMEYDGGSRMVRFNALMDNDSFVWEGSWIQLPAKVAGAWYVVATVAQSQPPKSAWVRILG
jgi:hypothetical protein